MAQNELFDSRYFEMIGCELQVSNDAPQDVKKQFEKYLQQLSKNEATDINSLPISFWSKDNENDKVWWKNQPYKVGIWIFSFDKKTEYNYYEDYPNKLTAEQKRIFDKENPCLAK